MSEQELEQALKNFSSISTITAQQVLTFNRARASRSDTAEPAPGSARVCPDHIFDPLQLNCRFPAKESAAVGMLRPPERNVPQCIAPHRS